MNENIIYLAGLFDGEGYAGLYYPTGVICGIEMNEKEAFEVLISEFGGNIRQVPERRNHSGGYKVNYSGRSSIPILQSLLPYLIVKKNRVAILIEYAKKWPLATNEQRKRWVEEYRNNPDLKNYLKPNSTGRPKGSKSKRHPIIKKGYSKNNIPLL